MDGGGLDDLIPACDAGAGIRFTDSFLRLVPQEV